MQSKTLHSLPELLLEPTYGYGEGSPHRPTLREVWIELIDSIAFWRGVPRLLPAVVVTYHLAAFGVFLFFLARFFSLRDLAIVLVATNAIGIVYNTVWYHRYCAHRAFRFRSLWLARLFLWTNPLGFREESYALPHEIHHSKTDQPGDPHGPHLGWLGSYFAAESTQKMNRDISRQYFERVSESLGHIGFAKNSYEAFRKTGSFENLWHYAARTVFGNALWLLVAYAIAEWQGVVLWISAIFLFSFMLRDFNYRGHGGSLVSAGRGSPINQMYFGFLVGEWHDNHHRNPQLARSGFAWWQLDVPYLIIRLLSACGAVVHYNCAPAEAR
jgi:sn-1 stearoyl-lipid 9-desaturase